MNAPWDLPGSLPTERLAGHFPDHVAGVLVVAQALEPRVAQLAVVGPLAEADLADEPWRDPVHAARAGEVPLSEGRRVPFHAGKHRVQAVQRAGVEPGAHLARVHQV